MAPSEKITLPQALVAEVQRAAEAEKRSADDVIVDAVKQYVENRSWVRFLAEGREQSNALGLRESDVDRLISDYRAENCRR